MRIRAPLTALTTLAMATAVAGLTPATAHAVEPETVRVQAADKRAEDAKRLAVIRRAKTWNPGTSRRVPYSQNRYHKGYRTDCSGYAAMALGLRPPGPNTVALASSAYSRPIRMSDLRMGDLVIDPIGNANSRHVVIFEKWANAARTAYWAYEQRGGYGTDYRVLSYGLKPGQYRAYRPKVLDGGGSGGGGGSSPQKYWVDTFATATGYREPNTKDPQGVLYKGTHYVYCRVRGAEVRHGSQWNRWWLRTDLDRTNPGKNGRGAYVSAYYLSRWGNDQAKDNSGRDIPNC